MPRVTDIYAALPSITGKFELEYEGELRGAEQVARDLIRSAVGNGLHRHVRRRRHAHGRRVVRPRRLAAAGDTSSADEVIAQTRGVQGLRELTAHAGLAPGAAAPPSASAIDFVLEGLYAQKKISRSEERGYSAAEAAARRHARGAAATRKSGLEREEESARPAGRKVLDN